MWSNTFRPSIDKAARLGSSLSSAAFVLGLFSSSAFALSNQAYVWGSNPTTAKYAAQKDYTHNPSGKPVQIRRTGRGQYQVLFTKLSGARAGVQVTGYGPDASYCKASRWSDTAQGLQVNVSCFKSGAPIDATYNVFVHLPKSSTWSKVGYAWANKPKVKSYTPDSRYAFQSNKKNPLIKRASVGVYTVNFPGLQPSKGQGGNVQASGYGLGAGSCKVTRWSGRSQGLQTEVRCFRNGKPSDSMFTVLANLPLNIGKAQMAYAWANSPTQAKYSANKTYAYTPNKNLPKILRVGTGQYRVLFTGFSGNKRPGGHAQVSAYGTDSTRCKVQNWGRDSGGMTVNVSCFSAADQPADTKFSLLAVTN